MRNTLPRLFLIFLIHLAGPSYGQGEDNPKHTLALQLANPLEDIIRIRLQNNYDFIVGPNNGFRYVLNLRPSIPIHINEKWSILSRTLVPVIFQGDVYVYGEGEAGLGDVLQNIFLTPRVSNPERIAWALGPVFLIPTATNNVLGNRNWAVGPAAIIAKRAGRLTFGVSFNHLWSYAGRGVDRSATFAHPFITYVSLRGGSVTLSSENSQNWPDDNFSGLISANFAKIFKLGKRWIQLSGEPKVYYGNNATDPDWGFRLVMIVPYNHSLINY